MTAPYQALRTRDGYVTIGATTPNQWPKLCELIGRPELAEDPRFDSVATRKANEQELAHILEEVLQTETSEHWYRLFEDAFPVGVLNSYDQVLADPHLRERGFLIEMDHPKAGPVKATGFPARLSGTPARLYRPAPTLGQHTEEILAELEKGREAVAHLRETGVV